jgi:hypothetical protein
VAGYPPEGATAGYREKERTVIQRTGTPLCLEFLAKSARLPEGIFKPKQAAAMSLAQIVVDNRSA